MGEADDAKYDIENQVREAMTQDPARQMQFLIASAGTIAQQTAKLQVMLVETKARLDAVLDVLIAFMVRDGKPQEEVLAEVRASVEAHYQEHLQAALRHESDPETMRETESGGAPPDVSSM